MTLTKSKSTFKFQVMGPEGDEEFEWNADDATDVANARAKFDKLRKQGYLAYRKVGASKGEQVRVFDPLVERVIFVPPMVGG